MDDKHWRLLFLRRMAEAQLSVPARLVTENDKTKDLQSFNASDLDDPVWSIHQMNN